MNKKKVKEVAVEILEPFLKENDLELFNIEFIKEGKDWYLRVYIDRTESAEGFVSIEDCEKVSRFLSSQLDEKDPVEQNYFLEVSSPGIDRPLLNAAHYARYEGRLVDVGLYKAIDGNKQITGQLIGLKDNIVTIQDEKGKLIEIPLEQITKTRLAVVF